MPGEAAPRPSGAMPGEAMPGEEMAPRPAGAFDGDVLANLAVALSWTEPLREAAGKAAGIAADSIQSMATSDAIGEAEDLGRRLVAEIGGYLTELSLTRKFQAEPLTSLFPVVGVSLMMTSIGVGYTCVYMPAMHLSAFSGVSIVFHSSFVLAFWSYHQSVITNPGGIPVNWKGLPDGMPDFALKTSGLVRKFEPLERKKNGGGFRFCKYENKFKPDRAHFCKVVGQNVLRMDHYCPWLANCVGYRNHKFFFLTLLYDALAANIANVSMMHALHVGGHSALHTFMLAQGVVISTVVAGVMTPFFGFHCWLVWKNHTTIEYCETGTTDSPYDLGMWHNVSSVLGPEWHLWLVPIKPDLGDGLDWPVDPAFLHKKRLPPNMSSTVASEARKTQKKSKPADSSSLGTLGTALAAAAPEDDDENDELTTSPNGCRNLADGSSRGDGSTLPRRKRCVAARNGACPPGSRIPQDALANIKAGISTLPKHASTIATVGRETLANLRQQPVTVPTFVQGGLAGCQECGEDLYSYSVDKALPAARAALSWLIPRPKVAPRMTSTVSTLRNSSNRPSMETT